MEQEAFTISEFCMRYRIGRTKAYELINSGNLRVSYVGRSPRVTKKRADELMLSLERLPQPAAA